MISALRLEFCARALCMLAFFLAAAGSLRLALREPVWAPRNELAHYDYIARIAAGSLPHAGDRISSDTFRMTMESGFRWKTPAGFDGTRESMGIEGRSYEAQQPPLYYAALAVPERAMQLADVAPHVRIPALRIFQGIVVFAGAALAILLFRELSLLTGISATSGWLFAALLALLNATRFATLGNDAFGLFFGNLMFWADFRAIRTRRLGPAVFGALACSAAMLTKYTSAALLPVHSVLLLALAIEVRRSAEAARRDPADTRDPSDEKDDIDSPLAATDRIRHPAKPGQSPPLALFTLALLLPFLLVIPWVLYRLATGGDWLGGAGVTQGMFRGRAGEIRGAARFLYSLVLDALRLQHAGVEWPVRIWQIAAAMFALNAAFAIRSLLRARTAPAPCARPSRDAASSPGTHVGAPAVLLLFSSISLTILAVALWLNTRAPGFWWNAFRHYIALQLPFCAALFTIPVSLAPGRRAALQLTLATLLLLLSIRFLLS